MLLLSLSLSASSAEGDNWQHRDHVLTLNHDHLLGDWGGHRSVLEEWGIEYELVYTGEFFGSLSGGLEEGNDYLGALSFMMGLDTEQAGLWAGGEFFLHVQSIHGKGITERYVGDFQSVSNFDAHDFVQISDFWYKHHFMEDRLWVKVGKMEANDDFAFVDYGVEFIHSSPGLIPTIPLPTFPDQDWGVVVGYDTQDWFSMNVGVFQGDPNGDRSLSQTFDSLVGPMVMAEPAFHYDLFALPGHFRVGAWWNGVNGEQFDRHAANPPLYQDRYGFYLTMDQMVWKENPQDEEDEQGVGVVGQYGFTPEDRGEATYYVGGGLQWTGALPSRDQDVWGVGVFQAGFSEDAGFVDSAETVVEVFYKYQALGWMTLKPDFQYIIDPGGMGNGDAVAVGLRWEMVF
jgi:porin